MIDDKGFRQICDRVFQLSRADETEILLGGGHENLTRFAKILEV